MTCCIVVTGISGVGKSRLVSAICEEDQTLVRVSGGDLIKSGGLEVAARDKLRELPSDEIERNQFLLLEGFKKARDDVGNKKILFDGHVIIFGKDGDTAVPFEVFSEISPVAFVSIVDCEDKILKRISADQSRKRDLVDCLELARRQQMSTDLAKEYASRLKRPHFEVRSGDLEAFRDCIARSI